MRWPWQRSDDDGGRASRSSSPGHGAPSLGKAEGPPSPAGWAFLPALQRTVGSQELVTRPAGFVEGLTAWSSPALMGAMGHTLSREAPGGVLDGDGSGLPQLTAAPVELPLAADAAHRAGVRRPYSAVQRLASAAPVQRDSSPQGVSAPASAAPALTSAGSEGLGVFNLPVAEEDAVTGSGPSGQDPILVVPLDASTAAGAGASEAGSSAESAPPTALLPERPAGAVRSSDSVTVPLGSPVADAVPTLAPAVLSPVQASAPATVERQAAALSARAVQRTSQKPSDSFSGEPGTLTPPGVLPAYPGATAGRRLGFGAPLQRVPADPGPAGAHDSDRGTPGSRLPAAVVILGSPPAVASEPPAIPAHNPDPASSENPMDPGAEADSVAEAPTGTEPVHLPVARPTSGAASQTGAMNEAPPEITPAALHESPLPDSPATDVQLAREGSIASLPSSLPATPLPAGGSSGRDRAEPGNYAPGGAEPGPASDFDTVTPLVRLSGQERAAQEALTLAVTPGPTDVQRSVARTLEGQQAHVQEPIQPHALTATAVVVLPAVGPPRPLIAAGPNRPLPLQAAEVSSGTAVEQPGSRAHAATAWSEEAALPPSSTLSSDTARSAGISRSSDTAMATPRAPAALVLAPAPPVQRSVTAAITQSFATSSTEATAQALPGGELPLQRSSEAQPSSDPPGNVESEAGELQQGNEAAPGSEASSEPGTRAVTGTTAGRAGRQGSAAVPSGQQLEELADKLYAPFVRRLKSELLLDRERRGLRTDLR